MAGMAHNLSTIPEISGVNADAHQLVDLVMGHNNLYVSIFARQNQIHCSR
jgi:two-component system heavy metal sensor histidine kinase CusS